MWHLLANLLKIGLLFFPGQTSIYRPGWSMCMFSSSCCKWYISQGCTLNFTILATLACLAQGYHQTLVRLIWSHGRNFSFQIFSLSRFFGHYWCYYWRHGHMHLVSKSPSNEMGNQDKLELTGRQKWPSQVACVLENVKCWGVWNTTCGHKAKDITLFTRLEERGVEKAKDITH